MVVRKIAVLATCMLLIGALNACSTSEDVTDPPSRQPWGKDQILELAEHENGAGHLTQAAALEDGIVTFDEYQTAFGHLVRCLDASGIKTSDPVLSPVSNDRYEYVMDFGSMDVDVAVKNVDFCELEHWTSVSKGFSLASTPTMDVALRDSTARCLQDEGVKATGDELNAWAFIDLAGATSELVTDCIMRAASEVFPDLPSVTVTF